MKHLFSKQKAILVSVLMVLIGIVLFSAKAFAAEQYITAKTQVGGTPGIWRYSEYKNSAYGPVLHVENVHCISTDLSGELTIPEYLDGYEVKSIGAYQNPVITGTSAQNVTSVVVHSGVLGMYDSAFKDCVGLKTVTLECEKTGVRAFQNCTSLETVIFSNSFKMLGLYTFQGCTSLKSINLPNSLQYIYGGVFSESGIESIVIPESVEYFGYPYYNEFTNCDRIFQNCKSLTSVKLPRHMAGLKYTDYLFDGCSNLTSIEFPENIDAIGRYWFQGCTSLNQTFVIPDTVTTIGEGAFYKSLFKSIIIPESVTVIEKSAFSGSQFLASIVIPESVTSIGESAFSGCTSLESIVLPSNLGYFSAGLLYGCHNLEFFVVPNSTTYLNDTSLLRVGRDALNPFIVLPKNLTGYSNNTISDGIRGLHYFFGNTILSRNASGKNPPWTVIPDGGPSTYVYTLKSNPRSAHIALIDFTGVTDWAVTRNANVPSSWTSVEGIPSRAVVFESNEGGTYYVWARDTDGNISNPVPFTLEGEISTAPSAPTIMHSDENGTFSIIHGSDGGAGVAYSEYQIDDGVWVVHTGPVLLEDGTYSIKAKTVGNDGVESDVISVTVTMYNSAYNAALLAVMSAESEKTQISVNSANVFVNALPDGNPKLVLKERLDAVQSYIDVEAIYATQLAEAVAAVVNAETLKTQESVDSAIVLVNNLRESDKTTLLERLAAVQEAIDLASASQLDAATVAVVTAETTKRQEDVDSARALVNALKDGMVKTDLITRLDALQAYIDAEAIYATQLAAAVAAVVNAETLTTQESVNSAMVLVNNLRESDKPALLERLAAVQEAIDTAYANQVAAATAAVVNAEATKKQEDLDSARMLVNALKNGTTKTDLIARLDALQAYIDTEAIYATQLAAAVAAVVNAETLITQESVNSATALVSNLREADKSALLERLAAVQDAIDAAYANQVAAATAAVVNAETTKKQIDVDSAYVLVNALKNGSVKTDLLARLAVVQGIIDSQTAIEKAIEAAIAAVEKAEASLLQADVNAASVLVSALEDETLKSSLQDRLDAVQQYIDARSAVVTAEKYKTAYFVSKAYELVNILPDSARKTALILRLEAVQYGIDIAVFEAAIAAVEKAEASELQTDIDYAWTLVNALPNGSITKTDLTNRLNALMLKIGAKSSEAIAAAIAAVETAELTMLKTDFDFARNLVDALQESACKTLLDTRLNAIEAFVNAIYAVSYAEASMSMETYLAAKALVDALPNGEIKTVLQSRLSVLLAALYGSNTSTDVSKAISAVEKAEKYVTVSYYNSANTLVEALADSIVKTWLQERLLVVYYKLYPSPEQAAIKAATAAVVSAEKYKTEYYILKAYDLVVALSESNEKTALLERMDVLLDLLIAQDTKLVETAEAKLTTTSYNAAASAVSKLPDCDEKMELIDRLEAVLAVIVGNKSAATLEDATKYVAKAEQYVSEYYYNKALHMTNSLPDSAAKSALLERLAAVEVNLDAKNLANATIAVGRAEKYKTEYYITTAITKVNALPDSEDKTTLLIRISIVQATVAVEVAETSKAQTDIDNATALVNALSDELTKANLQARLESIIVG